MITTQIVVPQPQIQINGQPLGKAAQALRQVTVVDDLNSPGMVTLELVNRALMPGEVAWADEALFNLGSAIAIHMPEAAQDSLINAVVTGLEPEFAQDELPLLTVRGYDLRYRLMRGYKTRSFTQMTDSEIVAQIAREANLGQIDSVDTQLKLDYVLQHNQTDLAFLQARAKRIGYELTMTGQTLGFHPPKAKAQAQSPLALTFPQDLLRFSPRLSGLAQPSHVEVRSWDMKKKAGVLGRSRSSDQPTRLGQTYGSQEAMQALGAAGLTRHDEPVTNPAEAVQMARGQFQKLALQYITGEGQCLGNPHLKVGCMVDIHGVGQRFGGRYYVTSATHRFGPDQGYFTDFTVQRNTHNL